MINRRTGLLVAQTLLGMTLLVAWLCVVDLNEVGRTLGKARLSFVFFAMVIALSSTILRALRWRMVLHPIASVPLLDVWLISTVSNLINFVIPLRTGEIARSLLLKRRFHVSVAISLPTIVIDRSFDLLAILILGVIGVISGISLESNLFTVLIGGVLIFLTFAGFVVFVILSRDHLQVFVDHILPASLSSNLRNRILGMLRGFVTGITAISRHPFDLLRIFGISLVSIFLDATVFYCLFASIGSIISPKVVLIGYALFALTFLVPAAPGFIGSMEAFGSLIFLALGIGSEIVASVVLLNHALQAVLQFTLGFIGLLGLGLGPTSLVRSILSNNGSVTPEVKTNVEG